MKKKLSVKVIMSLILSAVLLTNRVQSTSTLLRKQRKVPEKALRQKKNSVRTWKLSERLKRLRAKTVLPH